MGQAPINCQLCGKGEKMEDYWLFKNSFEMTLIGAVLIGKDGVLA